jgi:hypothetical protein
LPEPKQARHQNHTPDDFKKKKQLKNGTHMIEVEERADLLEPHKLVAHVAKGGLRRKVRRDRSQVAIETDGAELRGERVERRTGGE